MVTLVKRLMAGLACAVLLGVVGGVSVLQSDAHFHRYVERVLSDGFKEVGSSFSCHVAAINFFSSTMVVHDVVVQPLQSTERWQWSAGTMTISYSIIDALIQRCVSLDIAIQNFSASSLQQGAYLSLFEHIRQLTQGQSVIPLGLHSLRINAGQVHAVVDGTNVQTSLHGSSYSHWDGDEFVTSAHVNDGTVCLGKTRCAHTMRGRASFRVGGEYAAPDVTACVDGRATVACGALAEHACLLHLHVSDGSATGWCAGDKGTFGGDWTYDQKVGALTAGSWLRAGCQMVATHSMHAVYKDSCWYADASVQQDNAQAQVHGTYHDNGAWTVDVCNTTTWETDWCQRSCNVEHLHVHCRNDNDHVVSCTGNARVRLGHAVIPLAARATIDEHTLAINGTVDADSFTIRADMAPFQVRSIRYLVHDTHTKGSLSYDPVHKRWQLFCPGAIALKWTRLLSGIPLYGNGTITATASSTDDGCTIQAGFSDGSLHVPWVYNGITDCSFAVTYADTVWRCKTGVVALKKGVVDIVDALAYYDEHGRLVWSVPVVLNRLFVNKDQAALAELSGAFTVAGIDEQVELTGYGIIDRGAVRENIFAQEANVLEPSSLPSILNHAAVDVSLQTRRPIAVHTPFLQTPINGALHVRGTLGDPIMTGAIASSQGSLQFPYQSLHISKASIQWHAGHEHEPVIELDANNLVKNYDVSLHVHGPLTQPSIRFDSSPLLEEDQIIILLLAGSTERSLNMLLPALITQHIRQLVLGNQSVQSTIHRYFSTVLSPFKHIRLIPRFVDESGRGGLRGALEVEINERFRALIQKSFTMPEDTLFEFAYALSDDVVIKVVKDEHGDLGAELEVTWDH